MGAAGTPPNTGGWRDRATQGLAYAAGAEGPLKGVFDRLRRVGLGERVLKSALAASIAWALASLIPGNALPILAPITAMFSINLTIAGSMKQGWQRILGVATGIGIALVITEILGPSALSIGLVVLSSFFLGRWLRLEASGVEQMAVSALLVVVGSASAAIDHVALLHLANILIGTGVGLLLNASVAPPNFLPAAQRSIETRTAEVAAILDDLAIQLELGIDPDAAIAILHRARIADATVQEVDHAIRRAEESLAWNLFGRRQRPALARYRQAALALEHASIQTRLLARTTNDALATARGDSLRPRWLEPGALGAPLAELMADNARTIASLATAATDPSTATNAAALQQGGALRRANLMAAAAEHEADLEGEGWVLLGELAGISSQMQVDLAHLAAHPEAAIVTPEAIALETEVEEP